MSEEMLNPPMSNGVSPPGGKQKKQKKNKRGRKTKGDATRFRRKNKRGRDSIPKEKQKGTRLDSEGFEALSQTITRNEAGRRCRDTFASLKKTCRKLGVCFWKYLNDRVRGLSQIPRLADLIRHKARERLTATIAQAAPA